MAVDRLGVDKASAFAPCLCMTSRFQVYELNKGSLKLAYERETDAGIKCCTFGASSLEERHLVSRCFVLYRGTRNTSDINPPGVYAYVGQTFALLLRLSVLIIESSWFGAHVKRRTATAATVGACFVLSCLLVPTIPGLRGLQR